MILYLPEWGPVVEVIGYRTTALGDRLAKVVINWRGRPLVQWVAPEWLQVLP